MVIKKYAGIVLYNPDLSRLKENLYQVSKQVDEILLIDNASKDFSKILDIVNQIPKCKCQRNVTNKGVAYALNQILYYGVRKGYDWVLMLDQDSVINGQLINRYESLICDKQERKNIACVTCKIIDRNINSVYADKECKEGEIEYCITSGSFMKIDVLQEIGGFDNKLFIDLVDTDICIKLIQNGYKIIRIDYVGMIHEIGKTKQINIVFRKWDLYNHISFRRYYMARNSVYLLKKYRSKYALKIFLGEIFRTIMVLIFEKQKYSKLLYSLKGFRDGLIGRTGQY